MTVRSAYVLNCHAALGGLSAPGTPLAAFFAMHNGEAGSPDSPSLPGSQLFSPCPELSFVSPDGQLDQIPSASSCYSAGDLPDASSALGCGSTTVAAAPAEGTATPTSAASTLPPLPVGGVASLGCKRARRASMASAKAAAKRKPQRPLVSPAPGDAPGGTPHAPLSASSALSANGACDGLAESLSPLSPLPASGKRTTERSFVLETPTENTPLGFSPDPSCPGPTPATPPTGAQVGTTLSPYIHSSSPDNPMYQQWLAFARAALGRDECDADHTCTLSDLHTLSAAVHDLQARAASSHTRLFLSQSHAMVERYDFLSAGRLHLSR